LISIEPITRTLKKKVEKITLKMWVQYVPSSVKEVFCSVIQGLISLQTSAVCRSPTQHGVSKLCSKGTQPLLGARSPIAHVKITLNGMPNLLNYCAIFTAGYTYNLQILSQGA